MQMNFAFYKLTDPLEIKLTILYTLNQIDAPVKSSDIIHILIEATDVNYFVLQHHFYQLIEKGDIKEISRDKNLYFDITPDGKKSVASLSDKVPYSVKTHLNESIRHYYKRKKYENEITADITPINHEEYTVDCNIKYGNVPMLSLSMYAGSEFSAKEIKKYFLKHGSEIYKDVIDSMTKIRPENKDDKK